MNNRIVAEAATGFRKQGADARAQVTDAFQLGSITKPMTATLTARFVERGMLRWDLSLQDAFAELVGEMNSGYRKVTITQLLSHTQRHALQAAHGTTGFACLGSEHARRPLHLRQAGREGCARSSVRKRNSSMGAEPSSLRISWSGSRKQPWEELIRVHLFEPLKMSTANTGNDFDPVPAEVDRPWQHRIDGDKMVPVAPVGLKTPNFSRVHAPAGHANSSAGDLARFLIMHLPAGASRLLKPETLRFLQTPVQGSACPGWSNGEAAWAGGSFLNHNGTNLLNVADAYIVPRRNAAFCAMSNVASDAAWRAIRAMPIRWRAGPCITAASATRPCSAISAATPRRRRSPWNSGRRRTPSRSSARSR